MLHGQGSKRTDGAKENEGHFTWSAPGRDPVFERDTGSAAAEFADFKTGGWFSQKEGRPRLKRPFFAGCLAAFTFSPFQFALACRALVLDLDAGEIDPVVIRHYDHDIILVGVVVDGGIRD